MAKTSLQKIMLVFLFMFSLAQCKKKVKKDTPQPDDHRFATPSTSPNSDNNDSSDILELVSSLMAPLLKDLPYERFGFEFKENNLVAFSVLTPVCHCSWVRIYVFLMIA